MEIDQRLIDICSWHESDKRLRIAKVLMSAEPTNAFAKFDRVDLRLGTGESL
jgi:hypothetical protein